MRERPVESNFRYLAVGLVALLVLEPLADELTGRTGDQGLGVALALLLLVGIRGLQPSRGWLRTGQALVVAACGLALANAMRPSPMLMVGTLVVTDLFFVLTIGIGLRQVVARGPVTTDHLLGALCVYLLLGLVWALAYMGVYRAAPDTFAGVAHGGAGNFIYFSFVTLATLGYGDITPVSPLVRTAAYLEAIVGQLYVAVLVASLVSRHVTSEDQRGA